MLINSPSTINFKTIIYMVELLTEDQRLVLPEVILRRNRFKALIRNCIEKKDKTFSNAIIIQGKPGTGKTTLVTEFLEELKEMGLLDQYKRVSGHMTKISLFEFLKPEVDPDDDHRVLSSVHMIDDCDCINQGDCLEIMKSAFDTRSQHKSNRVVYYHSGFKHASYKYTDFSIIITNNEFQNPTTNMQALLDRVHLFSIDMAKDDFIIYNTYLVEKYLNENPDGLEDKVIEEVANFFNNYVKRWFSYNAFVGTNTNFSIRLVRKFIDLMVLFGSDWMTYSIDFKKLNSYCNINGESTVA